METNGVTKEQNALPLQALVYIQPAQMLMVRNDGNLEIKMAIQSTKEASSVNVVQSTAMPDKLALLRQTHVNIQFVPTLMVLHWLLFQECFTCGILVNVVRIVATKATCARLRPILVYCPLAQTLMGQNLSLVSKTATEIQLALTVNVVRTVVTLKY